MSRPSVNERLASLASAATEAFGRLGYRGTRTADVAAAAGMSAGSLFTYVESKEALFQLVFRYGVGMRAPATLPLRTPGPGETVALVERALRKMPLPRMRDALATDEPADVAQELRGIVEELYDLVERYWPLFAVIERCAAELPELDALWFGTERAGVHGAMGTYLERRMASGLLRSMPDAVIAARVVNEALAWFAWHRHEEHDSALFDEQAARRTVIDFVCAALIPGSAPVGAGSPSEALAGRRLTARGTLRPGHIPNSGSEENDSWMEASATTRPATSGYLMPTATGRSPS
jgi:AcrR family transcriptional regulator